MKHLHLALELFSVASLGRMAAQAKGAPLKPGLTLSSPDFSFLCAHLSRSR